EQVVVNLLDNAAKYTEPGGRISLSLELDGGSAILRVRDNGDGIAANVLPGVFDLFTQADRTLDRAAGGLGIGLSLVRALVELHQGEVSATSAGVGHGSEFVVRLPVAEPGSPTPASNESAPIAFVASGVKLLVVDDDVDAADSLALLLRMLGYEAVVAYSGVTALLAAVELRPSAVILDLSLPGMDGYELARLRGPHPHVALVGIIEISGHGEPADVERSLGAGFGTHLVKPLDLARLQAVLASLAATRAIAEG